MSDIEHTHMKRLRTLLGPEPSHPIGALLPQALLWSFRCFCIEKLALESDALLTEQAWSDFFELVEQYAPKELREVALSWLDPEGLETLATPVEEWAAFFFALLEEWDEAFLLEKEGEQEVLAEFLDEGIGRAIQGWLGDAAWRPFFLFSDADPLETVLVGVVAAIKEWKPVAAVAAAAVAVAVAPEPKKRRTSYRCVGPTANRARTLRLTRLRRSTRRARLNAANPNAAKPISLIE